MVRGRVRINAKNFEQSYIPGGKRFLRDIYVTSLQDRNRALEGGIVRRKRVLLNLVSNFRFVCAVSSFTRVSLAHRLRGMRLRRCWWAGCSSDLCSLLVNSTTGVRTIDYTLQCRPAPVPPPPCSCSSSSSLPLPPPPLRPRLLNNCLYREGCRQIKTAKRMGGS